MIMSACCCQNRYSWTINLTFYKIPSAFWPFLANRRRLWLKAIQESNGSVLKLKPNLCICGAHLLSGKTIDCYHKSAGSLSECLFIPCKICFCFVWQGGHPCITTTQTLYPLYFQALIRTHLLRKRWNGKMCKYIIYVLKATCNIFA